MARSATDARPHVLPEREWVQLATQHERRVDVWVAPHLARKARGERHPVMDFLFTYYPHRPAQLRRWHPGVGLALAGEAARERLSLPLYAEVPAVGDDPPAAVGLDLDAFLAERGDTVRRVAGLLRATAGRPAQLGCFGLHEWAMVYRQRTSDVRHSETPLRLGSAGTDDVVESHRIRCSHFDAFRFFTEPARPLNALQPSRADQVLLEQPGCLHASMDLYKWAYKLSPAVPATLVADCFALAVDVRELDMRASPYDLRALGYEPVAVETPQGKAAYVSAQRDFTDRAQVLRKRLLNVCDVLVSAPKISDDDRTEEWSR
jgi:hypothetical protein